MEFYLRMHLLLRLNFITITYDLILIKCHCAVGVSVVHSLIQLLLLNGLCNITC